jgi:hypothetical protein
MVLLAALLGLNAVGFVRTDASAASRYLPRIEQMAAVAHSLPDTNGDGNIILMAQDPYILRYAGIQSVMFPAEDRDTIIEVARRYGVDYLLLPADRPALDTVYLNQETDSRFVRAGDVPGTEFVFYRIDA